MSVVLLKHRKTFIMTLIIVLLAICMLQVLTSRKYPLTVSSVDTTGYIGVYSNKNCSKPVNSIDWGTLTLGQTSSKTVYVRNEGSESCFLFLTTANWTPANAISYLTFTWNCEADKVEPGKSTSVKQNLKVSLYTVGISNFSFATIFSGIKSSALDLNGDGKVNMVDIGRVARAFGSSSGQKTWDPACDINDDGKIDMNDTGIICSFFGE